MKSLGVIQWLATGAKMMVLVGGRVGEKVGEWDRCGVVVGGEGKQAHAQAAVRRAPLG